MEKVKKVWGSLNTPLKIGIVITLVAVIWFGGSSVYYTVKHGAESTIENYADGKLKQQVDALELEKQENVQAINVLKADNAKLKAEREARDKEIEIIKEALRNDGKIIASEQRRIDEATKKYNETKDSCASVTDPNAYVQCVCANIGITCD